MKPTDFARYMSAFLGSHLPGVRNVSANTIHSYRDTYRLLLLYCEGTRGIKVERLSLAELTEGVVLGFLDWIQQERNCGIATRNQRLAAIHALFRYIQAEAPENLARSQKILAIPLKRGPKPAVNYLSPEVVRQILEQPDRNTAEGRRDLSILGLLYDTGARVQELADLTVRDIRLDKPPLITLTGKGRKSRHVPLMTNTAEMMARHMQDNDLFHKSRDCCLFVNRQGTKFNRAGIAYILEKYATRARCISSGIPEGITPHVFRHSKAMHLFQSGVPLVYIRDLLGHADIGTTEIYARADTEMKRKALESAYPEMNSIALPDWNLDHGLLDWLTRL
jgi:site-specific recombinase XerD